MNTLFNQDGLIKVFLLFLILGFCAYHQTLGYPFVHDDVILIQNNPQIANLNNPLELFFQPFSLGQQFVLSNSYYRPLLELFIRVQYKLFGPSPFWFHFTNILLHSLNAFFVFLIFKRLSQREGIALTVALIFLLHPVQTQSVASIAGLSNILFAFFCLLSFYFFLKSVENQSGNFYVVSLNMLFLSLFIKESAVVFALMFLFYEFFFKKKSLSTFRIRALRIFGYMALTGSFLLFRSTISSDVLKTLLSYPDELFLRIVSIPETLLVYLKTLFFPHDLHYYRVVDILNISQLSFITLIGIFLGVLFIIHRYLKNDKHLALFGIIWFFITLIPTLNIIPIIIEYSTISTAEHFLYLPMIGLSLVTVLILDRALLLLSGYKVRIVSACVLGMLVMSYLQSQIWRSEVALFERTVRYEQQTARVYILLGKAYFFDGKYDQAINAYHKALVIMKDYVDKIKDKEALAFYHGFIKGIYFDLASSYQMIGQFGQARDQYTEALTIDPKDTQLHNNLGAIYMQLQDIDAAVFHFKSAVQIDSNNIMALNNLAGCYILMNEKNKAQETLKKILTINPRFLPAQQNLERLLKSEGGL